MYKYAIHIICGEKYNIVEKRRNFNYKHRVDKTINSILKLSTGLFTGCG